MEISISVVYQTSIALPFTIVKSVEIMNYVAYCTFFSFLRVSDFFLKSKYLFHMTIKKHKNYI